MTVEVCLFQAEPAPVGNGALRDRARELDCRIDANLGVVAGARAKAYIEAGQCLCELRDTKGYSYLGHDTWEEYLRSKGQFLRRTQLSLLVKIGQAGDLTAYVYRGVSASALLEYAKATDFPEMIPALIEETWDDLKDCSVREITGRLKAFVEGNANFRRLNTCRRGRKATGRTEKVLRALDELDDPERDEFLRQIAVRFGMRRIRGPKCK